MRAITGSRFGETFAGVSFGPSIWTTMGLNLGEVFSRSCTVFLRCELSFLLAREHTLAVGLPEIF